jgi:hypothetical protein
MKRSITALTIVLFFFSLLAFGMAFKASKGDSGLGLLLDAQAKDKDEDENGGSCPQNCSLRTLNGCFGFTITGTILGGPLAGPIVGIALTKFDGAGGLTQVDTVSINGTLITPPTGRISSGTYTVNPDCTGTVTINFPDQPTHLNFVLDNHGREIRTVVTNPGVAVTSIGRKQ